MIVCPQCGMSTWIDGEGCALPGCANHEVLVKDRVTKRVAEDRALLDRLAAGPCSVCGQPGADQEHYERFH